MLNMLSADNLCKLQIVSIQIWAWQNTWAWSGSKLFDTLMVFLNEFLQKGDFNKKSAFDKKAWKFSQGAKLKFS